MEQLTVRNLTFSYRDNEDFALRDISFGVERGKVLLIIGESGCGKTTLLKHLKPVFAPVGERNADWEILFDGRPLEELAEREQASKIGYVGQDVDAMQVADRVCNELAFGLESLGYSVEMMQRRIAEMSAFFGLDAIYDKPLCELSGGQKQMVNLASVMAMEPELLILDEPVSQLDPIATKSFFEMVRRINEELGTTIIMTEHRLEEAFSMCDKVVVMDKGRLLLEGDKKLAADKLFELKHPMYYALPTPVRLYLELEDENKSDYPMPFTVGEGKAYIEWCFGGVDNNFIEEISAGSKGRQSNKELYEIEKKPNNKSLRKTDKKLNERRLDETGERKTALYTDELWFRYEKNGADILKGCSISLPTGKITAILGGNGTGKSTLLHVLAGHLKPYMGKVKGKDNRIGLLPQNPQAMFAKKSAFDENLNRNPFDLSCGELQWLALERLVSEDHDILLLDEPGKGMDYAAKQRMGQYLRRLADEGKTILLVSHDVEFGARYADYCGLFFDGHVNSFTDRRSFFKNNVFYTTSLQRICYNVIPEALILEDVTGNPDRIMLKDVEENPDRIMLEDATENPGILGKTGIFEYNSCRKIVIAAVLTAIAVVGREIFYMLPDVKPVAALVILAGIGFGGEMGFVVGAMSMLISNIFFGQGPWTPWQMFAMGMLGLLAGAVFKETSRPSKVKKLAICLYGFLSVVIIYGGILNLSSVFMYQDNVNGAMVMTTLAAGLPFDLIHGVATFVFLFIGTAPLLNIYTRVKDKYGL